jgi:hypothetical protein
MSHRSIFPGFMHGLMLRVRQGAASLGKEAPSLGLLLGVGMLLTCTACAGPSRLEVDYGTSQNLVKFNQTLDPGAAKNLGPVVGFDGLAANAVVEKYREGFEKPALGPAGPSFSIRGINSGTGMGYK